MITTEKHTGEVADLASPNRKNYPTYPKTPQRRQNPEQTGEKEESEQSESSAESKAANTSFDRLIRQIPIPEQNREAERVYTASPVRNLRLELQRLTARAAEISARRDYSIASLSDSSTSPVSEKATKEQDTPPSEDSLHTTLILHHCEDRQRQIHNHTQPSHLRSYHSGICHKNTHWSHNLNDPTSTSSYRPASNVALPQKLLIFTRVISTLKREP